MVTVSANLPVFAFIVGYMFGRRFLSTARSGVFSQGNAVSEVAISSDGVVS
jgi:hypothetical protein